MQTIPYQYQNLPIPGGGYVTGFLFHPKEKGLVYLRTDIGGTYRYDRNAEQWVSLIDHVTMLDISETFVTALAIDPHYPARLYIACGVDGQPNGKLAVSEDYGQTFSYYPLPCPVHGNWNGRGTGARLVVDPNNSDILYFASQQGGLLRSANRGQDWESISIASDTRKNELHDTFIWVNPVTVKEGRSQILVLATAGLNNAVNNDTLRGHSLYISHDAGSTWDALPMPACREINEVKINGLVGHRYDFDGKYFYVTLSGTGKQSYIYDVGYSCDSGDCYGGLVLRYPVMADGTLGTYEDITPGGPPFYYTKDGNNDCGFGGISSCPAQPGLLAVTTVCERRGDVVFLSRDYGNTYEVSLFDLETDNLHFNTSYMKPEYNGNHSILHWLSDIKINPFDPDDVLFNSGTGVFGTHNFTAGDCLWQDRCTGIEETVHLNVYSPPAGDVLALDIVGDLGGFAFTDLNTPCQNSFADENGNRYITCINADYSDENPNCVVVTPRGNWTGKTTGGLILSEDQCKTFTHLPLPYGISDYVNSLLDRISCPNVNAGWVAMGPDCQSIVWSIADGNTLPLSAVLFSRDKGQTFSPCRFYDLQRRPVQNGFAKVFADRCNSHLMYAFDTSRILYISTTWGILFRQYPVPDEVPSYPIANIDTSDKSSVWVASYKEGVIYLSLGEHGIWKIHYDSDFDTLSYIKLTKAGDTFYKIGLGVLSARAAANIDNLFNKTIYAAATIDGVYGFYRSEDDCKTWVRINNDQQMFGDINAIAGDSRVFGRFFLATGSRGLLYGTPTE